MRRALPGPLIDLVRDGVRRDDLRRHSDKAVWKALVRTACSAIQRGWSEPEWDYLISEARSNLGRQARLARGRRERTAADYQCQLTNAWATAQKFVAEAPPPIDQDGVKQLIERVELAVQDANADLDDNERAVLAHACVVARRNGTTRPALPRREIVDATGLGERTVRTTLDRLAARRILALAVPGQASSAPGRRRATLYRLPDAGTVTAYLYRETRSVGPVTRSMGPQLVATLGLGTDLWDPHRGATAVRTPDGLALLLPPGVDPVRAAAVLAQLAAGDPAVDHADPVPTQLGAAS